MAGIQYKTVYDKVIETIFSALPTEQGERKKENDRRRRIKDKLVAQHAECLIVDSSYITADGRERKQYTNTILITESLAWWENRIVEAFDGPYTSKSHTLSSGRQTVFLNDEGNKFLTFSYYPARNKMMTQGSHEELIKWINVFRDINFQKNSYSNAQGIATTDAIPEDHFLQSDKPDDIQEKTPSAVVGQDGQIDSDADMPFYTSGALSIEADKDIFDDLPFTKPTIAATKRKRPIRSLRRQSCRFSQSATSARDSLNLLHVKNRLDAIDGVIAGLQGALVQVVESVEDHKSKTDSSITQLTDLSHQILEKLSCPEPKPVTIASTKDINQVKESVCQLKNNITRQCTTLTEQVKLLENNIQKSEDLQSRIRTEIIETLLDESKKTTQDVTSKIEVQTKTLNKQIQRVDENVKAKVVQDQMSVQPLRVQTFSQEKTPSRSNIDVYGQHGTRQMQSPGRQNRQNVRPTLKERHNLTSPNHKGNKQNEVTNNRTVLLVGDSTTKNVDKRRVLHEQVVSKCRASTIAEAHYKLTSGSNHTMDKVIFSVGLNDLRNGSSPTQVKEDMEHLLQEAEKRHTGCKLYVCSILPIKCNADMREKIKEVNSYFTHLADTMDKVFYVDILTEFVSYKPMQELFERDSVHPSTKGSLVMAVCIRNSIKQNHKTPAYFTSTRADISKMSYSESVNSDKIKTSRDNTGQSLVRESRPSPANQNPRPHLYQPRPFPSHMWWPSGNCYPPFMPFYPPGFMQPDYTSMYPAMREDKQSVKATTCS